MVLFATLEIVFFHSLLPPPPPPPSFSFKSISFPWLYTSRSLQTDTLEANRLQLNECFGFEIIAVRDLFFTTRLWVYSWMVCVCVCILRWHRCQRNFLVAFLISIQNCLKRNSAKFVSQAIFCAPLYMFSQLKLLPNEFTDPNCLFLCFKRKT